MDRTRWSRIEEIFELACAQPIEARQRFLAEACGFDAALRSELEEMLAATSEDRALVVEQLIVNNASDGWDLDPWLDTCVGPWRLVDVLGRGGMGAVYRAERADGHYQQQVALKLVRTGPRDPLCRGALSYRATSARTFAAPEHRRIARRGIRS